MIDILLSTYNGEKFLAEQLNSILAQTEKDWQLLIRDDGSTDSTIDIIQTYSSRHPEKISMMSDDMTENIGPCRSFHRLMQVSCGESDSRGEALPFATERKRGECNTGSNVDYVMFCDQDDVWLPEKIEVMLTRIKKLKKEPDTSVPILLHCDLEVVDAKLTVIAPSFMKHNKLDPQITDFTSLSIRNNVTGCAMMCNKALIDLALPMPEEAIMHDWWLTLTASVFGEIHYIPKTLLKYRQHSDNAIGVKTWQNSIGKFLNIKRYRQRLNDMSKQINAFKTIFNNKISDSLQKDFLLKHNCIKNRNIKLENYANCAQKDMPNKNALVHKFGKSPKDVINKIFMKLEQLADRGNDFNANIITSKHIRDKDSNTVCIFSHFDKNNLIDDYVIYYIQKLNKMGIDILFISTSQIDDQESLKIEKYCIDVIFKENSGYDFGAWKSGLEYLGNKLLEYEELIMCNDSVYAPLFDLNVMFNKMRNNDYDFWGISDNFEIKYHLQSYFMVFNKNVFSSELFKSFWNNYKLYKLKRNIIQKYEIEFSRNLLKNDFRMGVYIPYKKFQSKEYVNSTLKFYKRSIIDFNSPIIKIELLRDNPENIDISDWQKIISENTDYNIDLINNHLKRIKLDRKVK